MDPEISEFDDNFTITYENDTAWLILDIDHQKIPADR